MSVDGHVLGASTIAGGSGATASVLANTGNPIIIGLIVGIAVVIVLGFTARLSSSK